MSEPRVVSAVREFKQGLLDREKGQVALMQRHWGSVEQALEDAIQALNEEIAQTATSGQTMTRAQILRMDRYHALLAQVRHEVGQYEDWAEKQIMQTQATMVEQGIDQAMHAILETGIRRSFNRINESAVQGVVGLCADGAPLFDVLKARALDTASIDGLTKALVNGVALGWNPRRTASAMKDGLAEGLHKALQISRTEQLRAYRSASLQEYRTSGVVSAYKRLGTKDPRSCLACLAADGTRYDLEDDFSDHVCGRCACIPVVEGMPEVQWQTGADWFKGLDAEQQREMMGAKMFDAWDGGHGFDFAKLASSTWHDTWGAGLKVTSLAEVLKGNGGIVSKPPRPMAPPKPVELPKVDERGFPTTERLDELEVQRALGGSTGAELVRDPVTGNLYVRKHGNDEGHIREEALADTLYRTLGANVPEFTLYETAQGPIKLARFVEGQSLADVLAAAKGKKLAALKAELQKSFGADALLANWDVAGLNMDNILVDADGKVWRIDNGGSLRRRAQGALKAFDEYPTEIWSLRNSKVNAQTAKLFGNMPYDEIVRQIEGFEGQRDALLALMPDDLRTVMAKRLDTFRDMAATGRTFLADGWDANYLDGFTRHMVGLRQQGIVGMMPERLTNQGVEVYDEQGKLFDGLRGSQSIMYRLAEYMRNDGADQGMISYWMSGQAGSSWSAPSQATKYFFAQAMQADPQKVYWQNGMDAAKAQYEATIKKLGADKYANSWQAWHAFNYEFLRHTEFPNNDRAGGFVALRRTEAASVLGSYGITRAGDNYLMPRGMAESASIYEWVEVCGAERTWQNVPHHRVIGTYFMERTAGSGYSPFLGDRENEFVFLPYNIRFRYEKKGTRRRP